MGQLYPTPKAPNTEDKRHDYDVESFSPMSRSSTLSGKSLLITDAKHQPPPDGGWRAWLQAGLCSLVMLNTWGLINSFGIFQNYYQKTLLPGMDSSSISWIGSFQVFLLFFIGAFSGNLCDLGYFRYLFLSGSTLVVLGLLMTSLASGYWQLFIAQGICIGLGNGLMFCPSLSILGTYFSSKRSIALGICASGSALGGIIFPALFNNLLPAIGFSWTIRAAALIEFVSLAICNIGLRSRVAPKKANGLIDRESLKEPSYVLFILGMFFCIWGIYFPAHYVAHYAKSILNLTTSDSTSVLMVLNGVGLIGRIVPNFLADFYVGSLNFLIIVAVCSGIMSFCWIAVPDRTSLYIWVVFYGIVNSSVQSLYPAALSALTKDLSKSGTRMGMVLTIISFTALTGAPIAGQLIELNEGTYTYAQIFSGLSLIVGSAFLMGSRLAESKKLAFKI